MFSNDVNVSASVRDDDHVDVGGATSLGSSDILANGTRITRPPRVAGLDSVRGNFQVLKRQNNLRIWSLNDVQILQGDSPTTDLTSDIAQNAMAGGGRFYVSSKFQKASDRTSW